MWSDSDNATLPGSNLWDWAICNFSSMIVASILMQHNTGRGLLMLNSKINVFHKFRLGSTTLPWRPLRGWSCHCWNQARTSSYTLLMRFVNLATPTTICHHSHINSVTSSVFNSVVALNWRLELFSSLWCRWDVWSCKVSSSRMHLWPCWLPQMWLWDSEAVLFAIVFSNG